MWKCKKCYEELEDQFEVCWSCGTDKQGSNLTQENVQLPESEVKSKLLKEPIGKVHLISNQHNKQTENRKISYKVVPLNQTDNVPNALQQIIDSESSNGWRYVNHQYSDKLKPGNAGCFGFGATSDSTIHIGVVIFERS
jgi:hypothetical protein